MNNLNYLARETAAASTVENSAAAFDPAEPLDDSERGITNGLDYYKPTMSQLQHEKYPDAVATFRLINRDKERKIADYVDPDALQKSLDDLRAKGFSPEELGGLQTLVDPNGNTIFASDYLNFLDNSELPRAKVISDDKGDLGVEAHGPWALATFWETVAMGLINEQYMENYMTARGIDPRTVYDEGDRRLSEKIALLRQHPEIQLAEFGARRRFSAKWQKHVIERLQNECPANLVGTSNVAFALSRGLKPIGTYAHEMPMGYEGIAAADGRENPLLSHARMMEDWDAKYPFMDTALTDTFGSDFFWADFTRWQTDPVTGEPFRAIDRYRGVRHDSGDPFKFGDKFIEVCYACGIDPMTKTICFSDSLDIPTTIRLAEHFAGRVNFNFGIGTNLTNDLGIRALNIVMKAVAIERGGRRANLAKLSDDPGKHTGDPDAIARLERERQHYFAQLAADAQSLAEPHFDALQRSQKLISPTFAPPAQETAGAK